MRAGQGPSGGRARELAFLSRHLCQPGPSLGGERGQGSGRASPVCLLRGWGWGRGSGVLRDGDGPGGTLGSSLRAVSPQAGALWLRGELGVPQALSGPFSVVCAGQRAPGRLRSRHLADVQQRSLSFLQSLKVCPAPILSGGCGSSGGGWVRGGEHHGHTGLGHQPSWFRGRLRGSEGSRWRGFRERPAKRGGGTLLVSKVALPALWAEGLLGAMGVAG